MSGSPQFAFLFDLDGVIVDSMPVHTEAWQRYLKQSGLAAEYVAERMHGKHNHELVGEFFGPGLTPAQIEAHGSAKEALYREMMQESLEARMVPGVRQFLDHHAGVPKAVGSNAEPANVNFVVDGAHLRPYFQAIVDGYQVERPKPHPDIYLKAADLLKISPSRCIVFEDSPLGASAGRAAGAKVVGVETHEALENVDYHIRDFRDPGLEEWLAGIKF